ncbi:MAG: amidohydrolase family protein, partial [Mycetocola sp.]
IPLSELTTPVIDADAHISEPPGTFVDHVPARFRDRVPYVARNEEGKDVWMLNGEHFHQIGSSAQGAGWKEPIPSAPAGFDEMNPAAYDPTARLEYMDKVGLWAQVLYPNVAGFGAQKFLRLDDAELMLACVRAYNDFLTEWCSPAPDRLLAVSAMPFWDVDATVSEVHRCAEMGHRAILFTGEPNRFGYPPIGSTHWDPLWTAASETEMSISFHIGGGDPNPFVAAERVNAHGHGAAFTYEALAMFMKNGTQIADLLLSGVFVRFPKLKFVSVESGIGFLPFVLEAIDYTFKSGGVSNRMPELPSHYFREHVYACTFYEDLSRGDLIEQIGADNILFETDFPHGLCLYGQQVIDQLDTYLVGVGEATRRKITWENAAKLYKVPLPASFSAPRHFADAVA